MIDINELRRLAQAVMRPTTTEQWMQARVDFIAAANPAAISELLDRLKAAEKERDNANAAAENIALKLDYLRSKLETVENAQNDWLRANAPGGWIDNLRVENEALRAKVARMERQEPVAWMLNCPTLGGDTGWILSWTQSGAGLCNRLSGEENEKKLYALPGAQQCKNCNGMGDRFDPSGEKIPCDLCEKIYALPGAKTQGEEK